MDMHAFTSSATSGRQRPRRRALRKGTVEGIPPITKQASCRTPRGSIGGGLHTHGCVAHGIVVAVDSANHQGSGEVTRLDGSLRSAMSTPWSEWVTSASTRLCWDSPRPADASPWWIADPRGICPVGGQNGGQPRNAKGLRIAPEASFVRREWSGRSDSNARPPEPHSGALPGCATPRGRRVYHPAPHALRRSAAGAAGVRRSSRRVALPCPADQPLRDFAERPLGRFSRTCSRNTRRIGVPSKP